MSDTKRFGCVLIENCFNAAAPVPDDMADAARTLNLKVPSKEALKAML